MRINILYSYAMHVISKTANLQGDKFVRAVFEKTNTILMSGLKKMI